MSGRGQSMVELALLISAVGLLLLAGIALLAGGAYLLVHALKEATLPPRVIPERSEPVRQPPSAKPGPEHGQADPAPRPEDRKDDAAG